MLDLPPDTFEKPKTEIEQIVASVSKTLDTPMFPLTKRDININDPLYLQAKAMVDAMHDGFNWGDLTNLIRECFRFVKMHQGLSIAEQKQQVTTIIDYIIDLTDTPYLPDQFTDPLFKSLVPPMIDLISRVFNGQFNFIPILSDVPPSPDTFKTYIEKIRQNFADGFQWTDIVVCVQNTIEFIGGFPSLTSEQKRQSVIDIINTIIDVTDTPFVPDTFVDPILKAICAPLVNFVFDKIRC